MHCARETPVIVFNDRSTYTTVGIEDYMPFDAIRSHAQRYECHEWKPPKQV